MPHILNPSDGAGFAEILELEFISAADGAARIELTVREKHLRSLGIMHGGVAAALLDTVIGGAAGQHQKPDQTTVTMQLSVNFIRPAWAGERLIATAVTVHAGRQTCVARGEVHTAEGSLVATGTATLMFVPRPPPGTNLRRIPPVAPHDPAAGSGG